MYVYLLQKNQVGNLKSNTVYVIQELLSLNHTQSVFLIIYLASKMYLWQREFRITGIIDDKTA